MVPYHETRRGPGPAGGVGSVDRAAAACGPGGEVPGDAPVRAEQCASHGLSDVSGQRLADWFGECGIGVQDGGWTAPEVGGHALGRGGHRCPVPPACAVPERTEPVGCLLAPPGEPTRGPQLATCAEKCTDALPTNKSLTLAAVVGTGDFFPLDRGDV